MIVTIDGPAASGKGTIAKMLAEALNYGYMDTGMLYRAVGYTAIRDHVALEDEENLLKIAEKIDVESIFAIPSIDLRKDAIAQAASCVATFPKVRKALLSLQRQFAQTPPKDKNGVVLDGRDMGTVVCPQAERKLFLTASLEERARRRTEQLQKRGESVTYEDVLVDMEYRDQRDQKRECAPLVPSREAFYLDTSSLSEEKVFRFCMDYIQTGMMEERFHVPIALFS